jgi:hypothetical protein
VIKLRFGTLVSDFCTDESAQARVRPVGLKAGGAVATAQAVGWSRAWRPIGLDNFFGPSATRPQAAELAGHKSGAVAQLGERLICIQEVAGSIPTSSTILKLLRP